MSTTLQHAPAQVVIGTAGHVDHGKSTLVQALTGSNPDRLPQEQQRGLTIELGFAFALGKDNDADCDLAFVDCPGHTRFLRHAIAGMRSMNGCLLVIAADEGIAAQTREHFDLLRLLHCPWGRVIISKADLADTGQLKNLHAAIAELVAGTVFADHPPLVTDAHSERGIDNLRTHLFQTATQQLTTQHDQDQASTQQAQLAIDRVFTVKGHGTVVTGTLLGGTLSVGMQVHCHPGPSSRIRALQVRGMAVEQALAGQRTAINLAGVAVDDIQRGSWLTHGQELAASLIIDVSLQALPPGCKHGEAVRIHHGAMHVAGRLILLDQQQDGGGTGQTHAQLRLESELFVRFGDQLVIRRPSPPGSIGVATVLAVQAPRHKRRHAQTTAWFTALAAGPGPRLLAWAARRQAAPLLADEALQACGSQGALDQGVIDAKDELVLRQLDDGIRYWHKQSWQGLAKRAQTYLLQQSHAKQVWTSQDKLKQQLAKACDDKAWNDWLQAWCQQHQIITHERRLCQPTLLPAPANELLQEMTALLQVYKTAGAQASYDHPICNKRPAPKLATQALQLAAAYGWLITLSDRQHWHRDVVTSMLTDLQQALQAGTDVNIAWAKQRFGLSRRNLMPWLDWCDHVGLTKRRADARVAGPLLGCEPDGCPIPLLRPVPDHGQTGQSLHQEGMERTC